MPAGHVPQRSCVACRTARTKSELLRVVRTPTGEIKIDAAGKLAGRGAYICRSAACLQMAAKQKRFERALGKKVEDAVVEELSAALAQGKL